MAERLSSGRRGGRGAAPSNHVDLDAGSGALLAASHVPLLATVLVATTLLGALPLVDIDLRCLRRLQHPLLLSYGVSCPATQTNVGNKRGMQVVHPRGAERRLSDG